MSGICGLCGFSQSGSNSLSNSIIETEFKINICFDCNESIAALNPKKNVYLSGNISKKNRKRILLIIERKQQRTIELKREIRELLKENERLQSVHEEFAKIKEENKNKKEEINEIKHALCVLRNNECKLTTKNNKLMESKVIVANRFNEEIEANRKLISENILLKAQNEKNEKEINEIKAEREEMINEMESLKEEILSMKYQNKKIKDDFQDVRDQIKEKLELLEN